MLFFHLGPSCEGIDRYQTEAGDKHTESESMAREIWQGRTVHSALVVGGTATSFLFFLVLIAFQIAHSLMFLSLGRKKSNANPRSLYERCVQPSHPCFFVIYKFDAKLPSILGFLGVAIDNY